MKLRKFARNGVRSALGVGLLLLLAAPAWADLKIAFVDSQRLMQESPQGKAVIASLRSEFSAKQHELSLEQQALKDKQAQLERDGATMSADQRSAAEQSLRDGQGQLNEKVNQYQQDLTARENQVMSKLSAFLSGQVSLYAKAHHLDFVLASNAVIWHNQAIDITQAVLTALEAQGSSGAQSGSRGGP